MDENTSAEVSFGEWLRRQRNTRGLTRQQMAEQIGCAVVTLRKIESEERRPSTEMAERLAEILSIPAEERKAFLRFARGDWSAVPRGPAEESPWRHDPQPARSKLPASITSLVGRRTEIEEVRAYLERPEIRLVTLVGPPGIGKTRLSVEAARMPLPGLPGGAFFASLTAFDDAALIAPTVVQSLGYVKAKNSSDMQFLVEAIAEQKILLVLDNCEHVIDGVALLASELLSSCPGLKILATSREALRIPGEWLYRVAPLEVPEHGAAMDAEAGSKFPALALFAERARAVRSGFTLDAGNIATIASICEQLDGLPLAIELVAARVRSMSPDALLANLREQLSLHANGSRSLPKRQQTVYHAIDWSFRLLSLEEQDLLLRLSVFSGRFTQQAAESMLPGNTPTDRLAVLITSLLDKSLLQAIWEQHGEPHFSMLVTIRHFALGRLRVQQEEADMRNRHLAYFLELGERADREIHGPDQIAWMDELEAQHDDLRAALDWSLTTHQTEAALRLFGALSWFRRLRGYLDEARAGFDRLRGEPGLHEHPAEYARVLNAMGRVTWLQGDYPLARLLLEESQLIWQKLGLGGEQGLAEALDFLGLVARSSQRDDGVARALFEQSIELYQRCGNRWGVAEGSFHLGIAALPRRESALALSLFERSLATFRQLGDLWAIGRVSSQLGNLFRMLGDLDRAQSILQEGLDNDRRLKFKQGIVNDLLILADVSRYRGDYQQAQRYCEEGLLLGREFGLKPDVCDALYSLGLVSLHGNDYPAAGRYFAELLTFTAPLDAASLHRAMMGLAASAAGIHQCERSARLFGAARGFPGQTDDWTPPFDQAEFNRHIQLAREALGDERFAVLSAEGRAMPMQRATEYALGSSAGL